MSSRAAKEHTSTVPNCACTGGNVNVLVHKCAYFSNVILVPRTYLPQLRLAELYRFGVPRLFHKQNHMHIVLRDPSHFRLFSMVLLCLYISSKLPNKTVF